MLASHLLCLSQNELEEIHKFIQELLKQGTIRLGKGLYAANFFFVKKKDGKLHRVQDY